MPGPRMYQQIAHQIQEMIDSGAYPPNTRLPGERELAEKFGVSRVVIREAEISLEAHGRVEIKVGSGVYVRAPDPLLDSSFTSISAFDLTQTRMLFEAEIAAFAAESISDEQIKSLQSTIDQMKSTPDDPSAADEADREFHMLIAKATGNEANVLITQKLWQVRTQVESIREIHAAVCNSNPSVRIQEHADILKALRARDPKAAREAVRKHYSRLIKALLDASEVKAIEEAKLRSLINRRRYLNPIHESV